MKKPNLSMLVIITVFFAGFTLGLYVGRNHGAQAVTVSVPLSMQTVPVETTLPDETTPETESIQFPININTADKETLDALPGIGEVLAQRIVDYREINGPFSTVAELMNIENIGEKRLEAILDLITIGG